MDDGVRYEGDFVHGKASGRGTYTWPTGGRYEGDIVDDDSYVCNVTVM